MRHLLSRLRTDDSGGDLVEYVLLAALIGTAGAAALSGLPGIMGVVYDSWDAGVEALWETPDPQEP